MPASCPEPAILAAFVAETLGLDETETLAGHLLACGDCRRLVGTLRREAAPAPGILRRPLAWAAALLIAVSAAWFLRPVAGPRQASPGPAEAQVPLLALREILQAPATRFLGPGSRVVLEEGILIRTAPDRLAMDSGTLRIENLGVDPLALETPAGSLGGPGPWTARVRYREVPRLASLWCQSAEAASPADLEVAVEAGRLAFRAPGSEAPLDVRAGQRLLLSWGAPPRLEAFSPPPSPDLKAWRGEALVSLLGGSATLNGGREGTLWPFPLPSSRAYVVRVEFRPLKDGRLGLALPVGGGLRLWQLSGSECPEGGVRAVSMAVLGERSWGSVDGQRLWAVEDASRVLTPAPKGGLRVWGQMEILSLEIRVQKEEGAGGS
jgi:hypothetical protein